MYTPRCLALSFGLMVFPATVSGRRWSSGESERSKLTCSQRHLVCLGAIVDLERMSTLRTTSSHEAEHQRAGERHRSNGLYCN